MLGSAYSTKAEMQSILNTKVSDDSKNNSGKDSGGSSGNNKVPSVSDIKTYAQNGNNCSKLIATHIMKWSPQNIYILINE